MASKNTLSEKQLDNKLAALIEKHEGWYIKLPAIHIAGLPDRLCLLPGGRIFFAEIKAEGLEPRKLQLLVHSRLRGLGFMVVVVNSTEIINGLAVGLQNDSNGKA